MSPQAPGVTEFHSSILVTDLGHVTSSQPGPISRLFSASSVQDSLVKGEQAPLHGGSPQGAVASSGAWSLWLGQLGLVSEMSWPTPGLGKPPWVP